MKKGIEIIKKKWLKNTFLTILLIAIIFAIYFGINYAVKKLNLEDNKLDLKFFFSGLIDNQEVGNKCYFISKDSIIDKNNK